jgi:hypothetical protein
VAGKAPARQRDAIRIDVVEVEGGVHDRTEHGLPVGADRDLLLDQHGALARAVEYQASRAPSQVCRLD